MSEVEVLRMTPVINGQYILTKFHENEACRDGFMIIYAPSGVNNDAALATAPKLIVTTAG